MDIYQFIDNMINRLDSMTVSGAKNMLTIVQTIQDLNEIKKAITVHEPEKEAADAENQNQP